MEALVESGALGLPLLHPGGFELTSELARMCEVGRGTRVLDVACGTGEAALHLASSFGCQVTGADASPYMVEIASRKAVESALPVTFRQADAHHLPFPDGDFDAVISECAVCAMDKPAAIREMVRVAIAGGRVGIHDLCWAEDTPRSKKDKLAELEGERPETLSGWQRLFEECGLVEVTAAARSAVLRDWMASSRRRLGMAGELRVAGLVLRRWGLTGLWRVLQSQRLFNSRCMGYAIVVGTKPARGQPTSSPWAAAARSAEGNSPPAHNGRPGRR